MPRYLISFDAHAMDHIPDEDMPAVATDGTVTDGPYPEAIGGFCVVDVHSREEALQWAVKNAGACRCAQEVREFMPDPAVGN
jgi:hypothetical protein